jgi:Na+-driven multidrug efflux pump
MLAFGLLCHAAPAAMVGVFSRDRQVVAVGEEYLRITSWNYVASGLIFIAASLFQAMGNTIPSLLASFARVLIVGLSAAALVRLPGFELRWLWYVGVGSVVLQLTMSALLLRREFRRRFGGTSEVGTRQEPVSARRPSGTGGLRPDDASGR